MIFYPGYPVQKLFERMIEIFPTPPPFSCCYLAQGQLESDPIPVNASFLSSCFYLVAFTLLLKPKNRRLCYSESTVIS